MLGLPRYCGDPIRRWAANDGKRRRKLENSGHRAARRRTARAGKWPTAVEPGGEQQRVPNGGRRRTENDGKRRRKLENSGHRAARRRMAGAGKWQAAGAPFSKKQDLMGNPMRSFSEPRALPEGRARGSPSATVGGCVSTSEFGQRFYHWLKTR